jgi:glyoxylase-like metal-dependent hydrolase (beta-lactamase superfamily II)
MKIRAGILAFFAWFAFTGVASAQDLGPNVKKFGEGIYVYVGQNFNSNAGIILTQDGVVVIDTGQNPIISREIADAVKKLTSMPVRFVLDTEPHPDHTTGHFVFSPPAVVIAAAGAGASMRAREAEDPQRIQKLAATTPAMKAALEGYRFVPPQIEYQGKMTLNVESGPSS